MKSKYLGAYNIFNFRKGDADLKDLLPVDGNSVFAAVKNGVLLAKFVMLISPAAIDLKKFRMLFYSESTRLLFTHHFKKDLAPKSRFDIVENANAVIAGSQAVGCQLTNIGVPDIMDGKVCSGVFLPVIVNNSNMILLLAKPDAGNVLATHQSSCASSDARSLWRRLDIS